MKRTLIIFTCVLTSITMLAEDDLPLDYLPFVEFPKQWNVVTADANPNYVCSFENYSMFEQVEHNGRTYIRTYLMNDEQCTAEDVGLFREEERRVYKYDETSGRDIMLYDFSLKEGDTFTYEYGLAEPVNCKVLKQGWLDDGPKVKCSNTPGAGTSDAGYRPLRTWTIGYENSPGAGYQEVATWVECIGAIGNMFSSFSDDGTKFYLAYVERSGSQTDYSENEYLPFTLYNIFDAHGQIHGCDLPTGEEDYPDDGDHQLTYELEGDRLHIYGKAFTQCGPNNYAFFHEEETDDPLTHKIYFWIQEAAPLVNCVGLHATDIYVPGFDPNLNYIVEDNQGKEHPVINKTSQPAYRPVVEEGKHWTYDNYLPVRPAEYNHYYSYDLKGDTLIAGKNCLKMYSDNRYNDDAVRYEAALYEENKKVFCFFPEKEEAVLLYDFDCNVGDTLNVYAWQMVVKDIKAVMPGDVLIRIYTLQPIWDEPEDYGEVFWIEGVGATMDFFAMTPSDGNYNSLHACELNGEKLYQQAQQDLTEKGYHRMAIEGKRWNYIRFYLDENGEHREPYSYVVKGDTIIGRTTYKKLWYQDATKERLECLLYEEGRTVYKITDPGININGQPVLTVFFNFGRNDFGRVFTWEAEMGARNTNWMVYGVDTIEVKNRQFRRYTCLQKYSEEGESLTTIDYHDESVWRDIWVEGVGSASSGIEDQFPPAEPSIRLPGVYTYFVSCEENGESIFTADDFNIQSGEESPYRPFVEEGKVWKVGDYSGNPVRRVEYYYFDGDTIIDGKSCKQMMCQRYVSPEHPDYTMFSQLPSLSYVGAWYEEDKKVYMYDQTNKEFQLMYEFSADANDTLQVKNKFENYLYIIGPRQTGGMKGFKGVYRDVMMSRIGEESFYNITWLEGVGSIESPQYNVYHGREYHDGAFLMLCAVDDEVIYLNDEYEDGATPGDFDARKRRFDFTHTVKTKPKSPMKREAEESLYGEYNELQLGINLDPLVDAYQVSITDETGNVVYEKAIDAAGIVGLHIDISAYEEGLYTITLENDQESFTGEFEARTTGLSPLLQEKPAETIYNLQGQRLNSLRKGLNIVNGRKVYVK